MVDSSRQGSGAAAPRPGAEGRVTEERELAGRMRIEDCLREPEEHADELGGVDRPKRKRCPVASTSRKFLFRYLSSFKKRSGGGEGSPRSPRAPLLGCRHSRRKGKEMPREDDGVEKSASFDSKVVEEVGGDATVGSMEPDPGRKSEMSFNLGMGVGIAFALSRWETEFNRMKDLHFQMEMLLSEIRSEVANTHVASGALNPGHEFASSSDCSGVAGKFNNISFQDHGANFHLEEVKSTVESRHLNDHIRSQSMDQMEAELAFELEQLQLSLDGNDSMTLSEQAKLEIAYGSSSSSENGDPQEDYYNVHGGGVSARELERRLYELINTRQQERIAELESALELTTKSLGDKEVEVSWGWDASVPSSQHQDMLSVNFDKVANEANF
ncbi:protein POLAR LOCALIZATION DURING ASYMMETRIC DIVISION AND REDISTRIBUTION-like [Zingiber officinale]|uniref:Uncharacterized protein n=1 Tax=Zingiber officinale TaxID=94328 RepID=A0A8J5LJF9_ZINOF|nr:protein POLAR LOCALIZATION DURING ASYMMETRIC DIVISION AND REDISTRIBUTION-like [Zingiber officinale]KAG6517803.1 hypothetical protein ZIOFF_021202 [Zingiber officinale]